MRLTNRATSTEPYLKWGSGIPRRSLGFKAFLGTLNSPLRNYVPGASAEDSMAELLRLRALRAVLGTALFSVLHAGRVQRPAHDVITNAWQIFHAAAADEHNRVLLQVVTHAWNVRRDFKTRGELHT